MGKPYSQDLRERVIAAVDTGTGAYVAAPTRERGDFREIHMSHPRSFDIIVSRRRVKRRKAGDHPR